MKNNFKSTQEVASIQYLTPYKIVYRLHTQFSIIVDYHQKTITFYLSAAKEEPGLPRVKPPGSQ